ncbi:MAG: bifunctional YncE family protein/alkaline phosphatase family protein [Acidobacteria bacterium]|nr:bifunctional YncE family protein/alkaline phosphatase family protein [Acidobacteriota bacterium]
MKRPVLLLTALALVAAAVVARQTEVFPLLKSAVAMGRQPGDFYVLSTNQLLRPWGDQLQIPGRPVDLAFNSRKTQLAILNTRSIHLADATTGAELAVVRTEPTSYTGLAWRPGDRELWASQTARNGPDSLLVVEISALGKVERTTAIPLPGHPVPAGIAFSADGARAYVALSRNNSLAVIDTAERKLIREVPIGMAPFDVAVAAKQGRIFVSNRAGRRPTAEDEVAPSSGSLVVADPDSGATTSGTLTIIDARTFETREIAVGLAPAILALSPDEKALAVANAHSDSISLIDTATLVRSDLAVPTYPAPAKGLGSQPASVMWAPDGGRLYAGCGGNNSVAVFMPDGGKWRLAGAIPTGWFPSALEMDEKGSLRVINIKGTGNTADKSGTFNSKQYIGTLSQIPALSHAQLSAATREVIASNTPRFEPAGGVEKLWQLGIEHVFFIVKENRTYDQVFGDIARGNGEPKLVMYGREITPNHHALAERYVLLDNFHTGGAISFDGHQWLMQGFVSDYVERAFAAAPRGYAWNMADALTVSPTGFFWQGASRPLDLRIYGEFCLPARWDAKTRSAVDMDEREILPWSEYWRLYKEGKWQAAVGSRSGVPALQKYIEPRYPNSSTSIPDQIRAAAFLQAFSEFEKAGKLPQLLIMTLNSDHTSGTRPGSPTPRAMVADNDFALGRVVEAVSKSRFWAKSLILVVEDDAQNGLDHVDGHRTVALAIGPYIRRGVTDSNHYNHSSMVRTIQDIFRIAPRTRVLASARAMTSAFTTETDRRPYEALPPKVALDEMNPPLTALKGRRLWAARQSLAMNWSEPDDVPEQTLNRILWWDAKGWQSRYPSR